jgi:adenosylcobinamide-phosphate guanylyltransferase
LIAAVMCGGRASRMKAGTEKPLLKVDGVPMVERVILALEGSRRFDRIIAVVSPSTPKTREFLAAKGIEIIETAGEGYSQDLSRMLSGLKPDKVFVAPADVPLLDSRVVSDIVALVANRAAPAVSVIMDKEFVEKLGVKPSIALELGGEKYCHSGITVFDAVKVGPGPVEEQYAVMNKVKVAVNVNTKEELGLAEKLLVQRAHDFAQNEGI